MCGIAGVLRRNGEPVDPRGLEQMADLMAHRGPDARGVWVGRGAACGFGLSHARLSIIDVEGSPQPMHSADGRFVISFNGEILNYRELRATLDYPWTTHGDTEVVLAAFARYGPASFSMLTGQFAIAIVDQQSGELWLARDRTGILPLYLRDTGAQLAFASETKALAVGAGPLEVDVEGVDRYLMHRAVPAPGTMYAGVKKLPAGSFARIRRSGETEVVRYWQFAQEPAVAPAVRESYVEALDHALRQAVRRCLVADVGVGAYLSGGLDSSLITAMAVAERSPQTPLHTFAAGFGDPRMDELPFARLVAERFGTQHHEVHLRESDFVSLWPILSWHRDAPLSEPADVAVFRLAQVARRYVKVALSGEGSDELFGGYPKYAFATLTSAMDGLPHTARAPLGRIAAHLPPSQQRMAIALRALSSPSHDVYAGWFASFTPDELTRLTGRPAPKPACHGSATGDALTRMQLADLASWLPDNLLERGDRMSMAASVELRPPFMDRDVVDLASAIPRRAKVSRQEGKWIVRQVARRYLPDEVIDRRKIGFRVPMDAWLRTQLRDVAWSMLTDPGSLCSSMLQPAVVRTLLAEHDSGRHNHATQLWTLLSLEFWYRTCLVERTKPSEPDEYRTVDYADSPAAHSSGR